MSTHDGASKRTSNTAPAASAAGPLDAQFDAVRLEVVWSRLISIVDEAAKAIVRTSFSTLANEANDFACVLTDASGRSIAQNTGSIPSFIATLPATVRHFIDEIGLDAMRPGDVLITNDPWKGTGHLSDVCIVKPIFLGEKIVAFASSAAHVPAIGGRLRALESRQVFEEGLQIPLMKLIDAGQVDATLVKMIRQNVRTPEQTIGDIWAQLSANELMARRITELMLDYELSDLGPFTDEILRRAERAMRDAIRAVPDGSWEFAFDTDGAQEPYHFAVSLTIEDDAIRVDYAGTSATQARAINCVMAYTFAMTAYAIKCVLAPDLPNNDGMFRPIEVSAPQDTILNPRYPAAVVARANTGHYVPLCVFGALQKVLPDKVMAAAGSPLWVFTVTGTRDDGQSFANVLFYNGGMGATAHEDGESCLSWPSNISSTPVEVAERNGPLLCHYKRMRVGSGGAGRQRGGLGQEIAFESTSHRPLVGLFMTERTRFAAPGFDGAMAGAPGAVEINGNTIDTHTQHVLAHGDVVVLRSPGGGGYGDPNERGAELIARDGLLGYIDDEGK
ncbi:MAG: hydantoinase B/oxoprolinase family protein [Acidobacteria bacterium]|nr:hydantoinase B/oxoprolinase family protein [Acidobacteriota bacterium]